jgi:hypothetical protein
MPNLSSTFISLLSELLKDDLFLPPINWTGDLREVNEGCFPIIFFSEEVDSDGS